MAIEKDIDTTHDNKDDNAEKMDTQDSREGAKVEMPKPGMVFWSEEEVRNYYNKYAQHEGFGIAKISKKNGDDGMQKYFSLACARNGKSVSTAKDSFRPRPFTKTNCKAKINISVQSDGSFIVTRVYLDHNHGLNPGKVRHFRRNKILDSHVKRKMKLNDVAGVPINAHFHSSAVEADGYEKLSFGETECTKCVSKARQSRLGFRGAEGLLNYFHCMQNRNSNFFFMIDVDEACLVRNVFWADPRFRAAYESFGDVISFDTTYLTNRYDVPLVAFVGINHHGQSLLLGCGLLSNEDMDTYVWLFKTWLSCMFGQSPKAIVTDQCKAIQAAVAEVFPNSQHRLCLWHIMKKLPMKLGGLAQYKSVKKVLKDVVYDSVKPEEFEDGWAKMIIEYKLEDNEWLKSLYTDRHRWVPLLVKSTFWAGISTVQRNESVNAIFDGYVHSKTTLKQFLEEQYEKALTSKIEKESSADFASFNTIIPCITGLSIEKQFQRVYTNDIFKRFQDELRGLIFCSSSVIETNGSISTFEVAETMLGKDGTPCKELNYAVLYDETDCEVQCLCHLFEYRGILCRHVISVLMRKKVNEVPSRYLLDRWRKDIKRGYTSVKNVHDDGNDEQRQRNNKLIPLFFEVQQLGMESDTKCELLMKLLKEAKEKLFEVDSIYRSSQINQVLPVAVAKDDSDLQEIQSSPKRFLTPLDVRSPLKRKESMLDHIAKKANKKVFQGNKKKQPDQCNTHASKVKRIPDGEISTVVEENVGPPDSLNTSQKVDITSAQERQVLPTRSIQFIFGVESNLGML